MDTNQQAKRVGLPHEYFDLWKGTRHLEGESRLASFERLMKERDIADSFGWQLVLRIEGSKLPEEMKMSVEKKLDDSIRNLFVLMLVNQEDLQNQVRVGLNLGYLLSFEGDRVNRIQQEVPGATEYLSL